MSASGVLVIHRPDQDEYEPLSGHQEKHECGCGWWDYTKVKYDESGAITPPPHRPVETLTNAYYCGILCLPDGQLLFQPEEFDDQQWLSLLLFLLRQYPGHLASVIWCHS